MPTLRQIMCGIELGPGNIRLKEYGHSVTDGAVEAFIVVPETDIPFHVHITSDGYIAPGLSAYVFIDGEYQCNRNRLRLRFPEDGVSANEYQIDFKLRQKEEKTTHGTFIAREWTFTPLATGIADKAPNMKDFKDNVGTIEVVILRCKDGGGEELSTDPAQTTVSRNPAYPTRAPSVRAPSVRTPSVRAASTVKPPPGSFMGGMMGGIFDGVGDDPGYYKQYRPRNIVGQEHLPGHKWDPSSGQYRYFDDQDPFVNQRDQNDNRYGGSFPAHRYSPQTYTVGGGFSYQESVQSKEDRPEGPKAFVPQTSPGYDFTTRRRKAPPRDVDRPLKSREDRPEGPNIFVAQTSPGYDFATRRRKAPPRDADPPAKSTYDFTRRSWSQQQETEKPKRRRESIRSQQAPEQPEQREEAGSGLAFIEDCSHQLRRLMDDFTAEVKRYDALKEDAKRYHARRVIYAEILKAARRKYDEIVGIMDALGHIYGVVKQATDAMNRETWRRASDLLYEGGLYPPPAFQVDPPVELDEEGKPVVPSSPVENKTGGDGWEQVGEGNAGAKWDDVGQDNNKKEGDAGLTWGNDDAEKKKSHDVWADDTGSKIGINMPGAWNADSNKEYTGGWDTGKVDNEPANNDKPRSVKGNNTWGNDAGKGENTWGNDAGKGENTWGNDAGKGTQHGIRHESSSKSHRTGPVNDGAGSDCYTFGDPQPKPVIKPYWSQWTKKQVMVKPKVQPREVYEYPALPLPALPGGKADKGITHAVHAGRGANYAHKLHRPEYLDTMSQPYAIFTFKYRSKAALEAILKHKIDDSNIGEAKAEAKKHELLSKSKDELIEALMKKTSVAAQSRAPTKAATNKVNDWEAPNDKPLTPARRSSHRASPPKSRASNNWDTKPEVKPSDSVSQHSSKGRANKGWGNGNDDWENAGGNTPRAGGASGWGGGGSKYNSKSNAPSKASDHPREPEKSKGRDEGSKANWAAAGWGSDAKPAKSAATMEHFAASEMNGKTTGGKAKDFKPKW